MAWFPTVLLATRTPGTVTDSGTRSALWALLVGVPSLCVAFQVVLGRGVFTLHGDYLKKVKLSAGRTTGTD